jgi:hypothetical protein
MSCQTDTRNLEPMQLSNCPTQADAIGQNKIERLKLVSIFEIPFPQEGLTNVNSIGPGNRAAISTSRHRSTGIIAFTRMSRVLVRATGGVHDL